jgi:hypothetical protein
VARAKITDEQIAGTPMGQRLRKDGRRKLSLSIPEKTALKRSQLVERAVALFLDLENDTTWQQRADTLGITLIALRDLTKDDDFIACWNEHFVELGHDPRLRATQAGFVDLLSPSMRRLKAILIDE